MKFDTPSSAARRPAPQSGSGLARLAGALNGCAETAGARAGAACALLVLLAACASPVNRAPVEDRKPPVQPAPRMTGSAAGDLPEKPVGGMSGAASALPAASAEVPDRPGFYTVKPGDTLIRISLDFGQNWRDVARWSGLSNPNVIEVGQQLRVVPPAGEAAVAMVRPLPGGAVESRPLEPAGGPGAVVTAVTPGAAAPATPPGATAQTSPSVPAATTSAASPGGTGSGAAAGTAAAAGAAVASALPARVGDDELSWSWPATGPVVAGFDDVKSKGLAISGRAGDPVLAAADGRVVYAGSGLRGYGNLVIVKHNATYLTAYAHNQTLLVKEDQNVRRGQRIAEMGSTDAERVQLHFEIRRQGKPINPAQLLPVR